MVGGEQGLYLLNEDLTQISHNAAVQPEAMATLPNGNLVIISYLSYIVTIYNGNTIVHSWAQETQNPYGFLRKVIVNDDLIMIPSTNENRIMVYTDQGELFYHLKPNMSHPNWICAFDEGHVIITSQWDYEEGDTGSVGLFPIGDHSVALWKTKLFSPQAVCYDKLNKLIIVGDHHCIHILSTAGVLKLYPT